MSGSEGTPSEKMDTRYSTPAPELDDHRKRLHAPASAGPAHKPPVIPLLEVHHPTPRPSGADKTDLLKVDEALKNMAQGQPVTARDFEQAVESDEEREVGFDVIPGSARAGNKIRRGTNRPGRSGNPARHDQSRDTSSSRSSSPANSIEAFAETRRRQRANTIESRTSSPDFTRARTYSHGTTPRRPTLSNISVPANLTQRTDRDAEDDVTFPTDDEPGKTYKIDFEDLEEFVALCAQGKINDDPDLGSGSDSGSGSGSEKPSPKIIPEARVGKPVEAQNVMLNGEHFYEKPLTQVSTIASSAKTEVPPKSSTHWKDVDRFTFFSSEIKDSIRAKTLGGLLRDGATFRDLFDVDEETGPWWLDVVNPTKVELDVIGRAFNVHRLTREDIETQEPREKVELFPQYYFVCFRSFNMNTRSDDFLDPIHLYIIVCADGVLSFSYTQNPHAKNVRKRISKLGDFVSLGPDYICYAMIDDIVDSFAPIIRTAEQESENIEDQVFIAREDDLSALLKQIGECRKKVLNLMRLLGGKADVIKGFAKRCNEEYEMTPRGDIGLYLGDIQDHVVTMMSNLGHVEKMLSRSHANYLAQLNVDNILKGNSTNKALAKITVVATILVPLNLVTGLFGMNVPVPGRDSTNLAWFGGIIGCIALFVCLALVVARRMRAI
jgi:magnesium transporter